MYFKCKSCGSNNYLVEKNKIICNYCGNSYLYEEKIVEKKSEIKLLMLLLIAVVILGLIFLIYPKKEIPQIVHTTLKESYLNIDNTNAQIDTQIVNMNSDKNQEPSTISGKVVHHTKIENDKYTDNSIGYFKDENGNTRKATMLPRPKIRFDSKGNMIIDNKNKNLISQKVKRYRDENGLLTTVVTMSGFNKKDNTLYLDKKGIIPLLGQAELPGGVVSHIKVSKDATKLFYVSKYDVLYIVDIKQIDKPKVLSTINLIDTNDVLLSNDENRLYLNSREELAIFDISDKKVPKKLGSISSKPYYRGMVLSPKEDSLYIVKEEHQGLAKINIVNPYHPKEELLLNLKDTFWNPVIYGDKIYMSNSALDTHFTILDLNNMQFKKVDTPLIDGIHNITLFDKYILFRSSFYEIALFKDERGVIKKVNYLNYQAAWHNFYKRIRDMEFTPNGKYLAFIANKNAISFKRFKVILPTMDKDSLYDKNDYFGNYYSSIVQPNIDEIKDIIISKDGKKLFAFSRSDVFVYDISRLE